MISPNVLSYVTHATASRRIVTAYSGRLGQVDAPLEKLIEVFGDPMYIDENESDGKTTMEWHIRFSDGSVATIYDYKRDPIFHVGGFKQAALANVLAALGE